MRVAWALLLAPRSAAGGALSRTLLDKHPNAVCMDGSPAAYYFLDSPGASVLHISMEGGGSCVDKSSCDMRCTNQSRYCSSINMPATMDIPYGGLLGRDCGKSPDFCNASFAWVRYCSSDWYAGHADPSPDTFGYHFRGADVMDAVFRDLAASLAPGVTRVLFSGGSGGGEGVAHNCDKAAAAFRAKGVAVSCLIDAAWDNWYPAATGDACEKTRQRTGQLGKPLWNATYNAACEAAAATGDEWRCFSGPVLFPHLTAPLFVAQGLFDPVQMKQECFEGSGLSIDGSWAQGFAASLAAEVAGFVANATVPRGAWASSCTQHVQMGDDDGAFTREVDGVTLQAAVAEWWSGACADCGRVESCAAKGPCNPDAKCDRVPPPAPPVPAGCHDCASCVAALCPGETGMACQHCAQAHKAVLLGQGCTLDKMEKICHGGDLREGDGATRP